jgi:non-homologous end joining protein Ku
MAARSTWKGSVQIQFADTPLPIPVPVAVYTATKSRRSESFKMLDPVFNMPVSQRLVDKDGTVIERSSTVKGVEAGPGQYVALTEQGLELIGNVGRTPVVNVERFAPIESIDFNQAIEHYVITPDPKVAGADAAVQVLWNGLRASHRAAVIQNWAAKENSKPSILVITAQENGLVGTLIAYARERNDVPSPFVPQVNEEIGQMFEKAVRNYNLDYFDAGVYTDSHAERRQQAIDLALSGAPLDEHIAAAQPAEPQTPNLMAALQASLAGMAPKQPAEVEPEKEEVVA